MTSAEHEPTCVLGSLGCGRSVTFVWRHHRARSEGARRGEAGHQGHPNHSGVTALDLDLAGALAVSHTRPPPAERLRPSSTMPSPRAHPSQRRARLPPGGVGVPQPDRHPSASGRYPEIRRARSPWPGRLSARGRRLATRTAGYHPECRISAGVSCSNGRALTLACTQSGHGRLLHRRESSDAGVGGAGQLRVVLLLGVRHRGLMRLVLSLALLVQPQIRRGRPRATF